jgi:ribosomal protein S27AE
MSIRIESEGKDLNIAHKPYRITCGTCSAKFTFIEKDAQVEHDEAGLKRVSVYCPSCGTLLLADHHENDAVRVANAEAEARRVADRGKVKRP